MIGLMQRVSEASVTADGETLGAIGQGILVLVCAEPGDTERSAERLLERLLGYRVFSDTAGKMNRSLKDIGGGLLLVPQFTLAADTTKGLRASFSSAAAPELGAALFEHLVAVARRAHASVAAGRFGAHMRVSLVNDGPVTFWLRVDPAKH
jgi:D-aminoacyl-tRNA deacylase